jgi:hypothetical protein
MAGLLETDVGAHADNDLVSPNYSLTVCSIRDRGNGWPRQANAPQYVNQRTPISQPTHPNKQTNTPQYANQRTPISAVTECATVGAPHAKCTWECARAAGRESTQ